MVQPVSIPTPRSELTPEEDWRIRRRPRLVRAALLVASLALLALIASTVFSDQLTFLAWHPGRPYRWQLCGRTWLEGARAYAIYTRHPKWCAHAPLARLDCAATCEGSLGAAAWDVCEARCPPDRLKRMWLNSP